jgi:hypothetical protein
MHGLYIYGPTVENGDLVFWGPVAKSWLYLTSLTMHGGTNGLMAFRQAYLAGAQLAGCVTCSFSHFEKRA